jgi:threonine/homoserine/homoserine lactone efflux protein
VSEGLHAAGSGWKILALGTFTGSLWVVWFVAAVCRKRFCSGYLRRLADSRPQNPAESEFLVLAA